MTHSLDYRQYCALLSGNIGDRAGASVFRLYITRAHDSIGCRCRSRATERKNTGEYRLEDDGQIKFVLCRLDVEVSI